tara:strand:+ start:293 stop:559 length:267 start_codon:yes stop_codon:yes gene_type:complete
MTIGFSISVGGSKGRPGGFEFRACIPGNVWIGDTFYEQSQLLYPCTPSRPNLRTMIKTNDWWYQKGNNSSTSLIHTTGGSLAAIKRRT